MIPIVTLDKTGKINGQQAFNDNLTMQEQIGRSILTTVMVASQKLTNDKNAIDKIIMEGSYDSAKLEALNEAAIALNKAISEAIATFEEALIAE